MAIGPGKYDYLAGYARQQTNADAVILIVLKNEGGSGFACQARDDITSKIPELLRAVADSIEHDTQAKHQN
jgi:hypothetical protein